jgi:glycosyltransferase involved in cell wall biosynthesis
VCAGPHEIRCEGAATATDLEDAQPADVTEVLLRQLVPGRGRVRVGAGRRLDVTRTVPFVVEVAHLMVVAHAPYRARIRRRYRRGSEEAVGTNGDGRLRVLVVTVAAGGLGGMQQHTHDLVRGLLAAGHDVEVACPSDAGLVGDLYGARWTLLGTTDRNDPAWERELVAAYAAADARGRIDVVHSESTSAAALARRRIPAPIAVLYHGNYLGLAHAHLRRAAGRPATAPNELWRLGRMTWDYLRNRNAWALRGCETMVVSQQQAAATARSILLPAGRIHVVPNGVDVATFRPQDKTPLRRALGLPDGLLACAVGRLNREKGFEVAIAALSRLARAHSELRLVVVGEGEERAALERLAAGLGLDDRIVFVGAVPPAAVADYLAAADLFVFPTRRDEAGPLVLPQAMACGLPVVASRIGGIPEVVAPAGGAPAGVLVPPGDAEALAQAIDELARDAQARAELGRTARDRAVTEYSLERMTERTVAVYRTAIARSAGTR